tara:strand:+ start:303 stop:614 length:312 start_codon:yes stop_codon:yes gene_type:complete
MGLGIMLVRSIGGDFAGVVCLGSGSLEGFFLVAGCTVVVDIFGFGLAALGGWLNGEMDGPSMEQTEFQPLRRHRSPREHGSNGQDRAGRNRTGSCRVEELPRR